MNTLTLLLTWIKALLTPRVRRWVYGVAIAAFAVLVYYGVIDPEASPLLLALVLAILNVPTGDSSDGDVT